MKKFINLNFLVSICFLVWIVFFDSYNLMDTFKIIKQIDMQKPILESFKLQAELNSHKIQKTLQSNFAIESFARENYKMKKHNEDIYIIKE